MERRRFLLGSAAGAALWSLGPLAVACGGDSETAKAAEARADIPRVAPSDADRSDAKALARANAAFGWDLYATIAASAPGSNVFCSPHSISQALALAFAGARGSTASEMAAALHYELPTDRLHRAFNALEQGLANPPASEKAVPFTLNIANSAWAQEGHPFERAYLETLAAYYGAGIRLADFIKEAEAARKSINGWVSDRTNQRIKDLLPPGSVTALTRLVLANAIFFKADWLQPFGKEATQPGAFTRADFSVVQVPKMQQTASFAYARADDVEAVELRYTGSTSAMLILLPGTAGALGTTESQLATLAPRLIDQLSTKRVDLSLPKWGFTSQFALVDTLKALGITTAFDPTAADFSGMDGGRDLFISGVYHKAFVKVDEQGTEAAAATGVVVGTTSAPTEPPIVVDVNRPFAFLIRDIPTGAVLFVGRVMDPSAA